jgi:hypothetical protein
VCSSSSSSAAAVSTWPAVTANPTGAWVTQQARKFAWTLQERRRFASSAATGTASSLATLTPSRQRRNRDHQDAAASVSGTQIHPSCCPCVFVDQSAESIASVLRGEVGRVPGDRGDRGRTRGPRPPRLNITDLPELAALPSGLVLDVRSAVFSGPHHRVLRSAKSASPSGSQTTPSPLLPPRSYRFEPNLARASVRE